MKITKILLEAKHWQLFLLTFALPFLVQFGIMSTLMEYAMGTVQGDISPSLVSRGIKAFLLLIPIILAPTIILMAWLWSIPMGLRPFLPEGVSMSYGRFKLFFFFPVIYVVLFFALFAGIIPSMIDSTIDPESVFQFMPILIALHFFAMFCMFHTIYFAAKVLVTVEKQQQVTLGEYIGEFFLLWFNIIGIWLIQPRVNQIIGRK